MLIQLLHTMHPTSISFPKPGDYFGLGGVLIQDQWNPVRIH